jgi:cytochrome c oxidase subunit 4
MSRAPIPAVGTSLLALAGLLLLTAATVALAFLALPGPAHVALAMTIAALKAGLIAACFMHLGHEDRPTRTMAISGVAWLAILFLFVLADFLTRS